MRACAKRSRPAASHLAAEFTEIVRIEVTLTRGRRRLHGAWPRDREPHRRRDARDGDQAAAGRREAAREARAPAAPRPRQADLREAPRGAAQIAETPAGLRRRPRRGPASRAGGRRRAAPLPSPSRRAGGDPSRDRSRGCARGCSRSRPRARASRARAPPAARRACARTRAISSRSRRRCAVQPKGSKRRRAQELELREQRRAPGTPRARGSTCARARCPDRAGSRSGARGGARCAPTLRTRARAACRKESSVHRRATSYSSL